MITLILKNVNLTVNRLHIRYEDDYYASQHPFAFGIICDVRLMHGITTVANDICHHGQRVALRLPR